MTFYSNATLSTLIDHLDLLIISKTIRICTYSGLYKYIKYTNMNFDKLSPKDCVHLQVYLQLDNKYGFVERLLSCNTCHLFECVHILINICFIQEKSAV